MYMPKGQSSSGDFYLVTGDAVYVFQCKNNNSKLFNQGQLKKELLKEPTHGRVKVHAIVLARRFHKKIDPEFKFTPKTIDHSTYDQILLVDVSGVMKIVDVHEGNEEEISKHL